MAFDVFFICYSSLFFFCALPIDKLKIDRSFVATLTAERENATIVRALVGLGNALGLHVTAEGVEDNETADALRVMGCEFAQGYLFGPAVESPVYVQGQLRASA